MGANRARSREEEADHLLALYGGEPARVMGTVETQLAVLASRAQTLLSLTSITITVTGFSGASIAKSGPLAAALIVLGLVFVLLGAALAISGILAVEWTTAIAPAPLRDALLHALARRDEKTQAYSRALYFVITGLAAYVASVSLLLLGAAGPPRPP